MAAILSSTAGTRQCGGLRQMRDVGEQVRPGGKLVSTDRRTVARKDQVLDGIVNIDHVRDLHNDALDRIPRSPK